MVYVDYNYYKESYKGTAIPEFDFDRLAMRASEYIDGITKGKATYAEGQNEILIKRAACAVAEAWQMNEQGGDITSQTVGSWSKSYIKTAKSDNDRLYEAAYMYLAATGLMPKVRWA